MKNRIIKLIINFTFIALFLALIYFAFLSLLPNLIPVLKSGDEKIIEQYLRSSSLVSSMVCTAVLQIMQVISIAFPGLPIQIAAGIVFGVVRGFLICHLSYVFANLFVFFCKRKLGNQLERLFPNETKSPISHWFHKKGHPSFFVFLGNLMPGLPNGIIPHLAADTKISPYKFILAVYIGSFPPILINTLIGKYILYGNYLLSAILLFGQWILIFLFYKKRDVFIRFFYTKILHIPL